MVRYLVSSVLKKGKHFEGKHICTTSLKVKYFRKGFVFFGLFLLEPTDIHDTKLYYPQF